MPSVSMSISSMFLIGLVIADVLFSPGRCLQRVFAHFTSLGKEFRHAPGPSRHKKRRQTPPFLFRIGTFISVQKHEIFSGRFAVTTGNEFEFDLCVFLKGRQSGAFNCRNMHESVSPASIRSDKTISFGGVEPLYSTCSHYLVSWTLDNYQDLTPKVPKCSV